MRPAPIHWRVVVNAYPCDTCVAGPGEDCVTYNGNRKHEPHASRSRQAAANDWSNPDVACLHRAWASSPARKPGQEP